MHVTIVAALVAALVSLIGLLVNLRIAKETRKTNAIQLQLAAGLKAAENSINNYRIFLTEAEKLRIALWDIYRILERCLRPSRIDENDKKNLAEAISRYCITLDSFSDVWASVKDEIPNEQAQYIRAVRHEILNRANNIKYSIKELQGQVVNITSSKDEYIAIGNIVKDIEQRIIYLLSIIDGFFLHVRSIKESIVVKHIEK